ncbi:MAG TPA: hypothetical protein VN796_07930 [Acidimicrobiales bacterium]|nr:hypothetical protein [Acidimicrobiales bacterium]
MAATGADDDGTCANCGGPGDGLEEVRRVYVTVDDHGRVTGSEAVDPPEPWCLACRTLYPHLPQDQDPDSGPGAPRSGDPPPRHQGS